MKRIVPQTGQTCQATSVALDRGTRTTDVVLPEANSVDVAIAESLARLRSSVKDLDYSLEALAVAMGEKPEYKAYISRVLNGEKPLTHAFLIALPDDVEALWHSKEAEAFGRIVVTPASGADAPKQFIAGFLGLMHATALPSTAGVPLKAAMPEASTEATRRRA